MTAPRRVLGYALRALARDWRAGELRLIVAALVIAVTAMTTVAFLTDRVRGAMDRDAGALLGGDLALESSNAIDEDFADRARARGLAIARTVALRSMVTHGDRLELIELKAVDAGYPLRGAVAIAPAPFAAEREVGHGPPRGEVWIETRLLSALGISIGDRIGIGASEPKTTAVLALEPDRGGDQFSIAPRVLMHWDDVAATGLIGPGSRVTHRLLVAGSTAGVVAWRAEIAPRLNPSFKFRDVRDARPELTAALKRAEQFLALAALAAVIVAGVAIALACARYATRHYDSCAMLRCLGATQGFITSAYATVLLILAVGGGALGTLAGYLGQSGLALLLGPVVSGGLPPPSWRPYATGMVTAFVACIGFALPALERLRRVSPLRVLRRDVSSTTPTALLTHCGAAAVIVVLAPWRAQQPLLVAYIVGAAAGTALLLALAARALVMALDVLRAQVGSAWRFGLANVARRGATSALQIVALGLGVLVMLLLAMVRTDLLASWKATLPPGAPNRFLVNIQTDQVPQIRAWFDAHGFPAPALFPMVRARLTHVNGNPVRIEDYTEPRARRLADREFNLSWTAAAQTDNRLIEGRWWSEPPEPGQFSFEVEIAATLGIGMGDELTFFVAGEPLHGRVTSLREVAWDSFNVNFFVLCPPGMLDAYPATWITAFHLPDRDAPILNDLVRRFPSVTVIDVAALERHVRRVMDQVTRAVEFVFAFTIAAGLLVLYAAVSTTHDARVHETALLRALGARTPVLLAGLLAEIAALGASAGAVAAFGAITAGWLLATQVFDIPYRLNPWLPPVAVAAAIAGVTLATAITMHASLYARPSEVLRRG
jgi:putative ABC transport system permease protein